MTGIRFDGAITYWTAGEYTNLQIFNQGLEDLYLKKFQPKPRTDAAALKDALNDVCGARHNNRDNVFRIERLADNEAFQVDRIERGDLAMGGNLTIKERTAWLDNGGTVQIDPFDLELHESIVQHYQMHRNQIRGTTITRAMVDVIRYLGGISLRDSGGVYWLPEKALFTWNEVMALAERSSIKGRMRCHMIRHQFDEDALKAIKDAFTHEILAESKRLEKEMEELDVTKPMGDRAKETRMAHCKEMLLKISNYEDILGETLTVLRSAVESAENAVCTGALLTV